MRSLSCQKCGKSMNDMDVFCSSCGNKLAVSGNTMLENAELRVKAGSVGSTYGEMMFELIIKQNGVMAVQIYAHDPSDGRKSGVIINLNKTSYQTLKDIIQKIDFNASELLKRRG